MRQLLYSFYLLIVLFSLSSQAIEGITTHWESDNPKPIHTEFDSVLFEQTKQAAKNRKDVAQLYLGQAYELGNFVEFDYHKAEYWYQKTTEQNDYEGIQNYLALNKLTYKEADTLAKAGNPNAQLQLCYMYFNGDEIEISYKKAVHWYTQSAIGGQINVQQDLARMFFGRLIVK